jgi:hypothetical protein
VTVRYRGVHNRLQPRDMLVTIANMEKTYKGLSLQRGQVMIEYLVIAGMLLATVAILAVLLYVFKEQSGRVLDLAASEYP